MPPTAIAKQEDKLLAAVTTHHFIHHDPLPHVLVLRGKRSVLAGRHLLLQLSLALNCHLSP